MSLVRSGVLLSLADVVEEERWRPRSGKRTTSVTVMAGYHLRPRPGGVGAASCRAG